MRSSPVFESVLEPAEVARLTAVLAALQRAGLDGALTGGLAVALHLHALGVPLAIRRLNDIDFVVRGIDDVPAALADGFLQNHVHPTAPEGKTLIQLVDPVHSMRVDFFRAFGDTLSRTVDLPEALGMRVVSLEDLRARVIAHVCGALGRGRTIDVKHVRTFERLAGRGRSTALAEAWRDHRQEVEGAFDEAVEEAHRLIEARPELIVVETYARRSVACERCVPYGRFSPAPPDRIADILGYS